MKKEIYFAGGCFWGIQKYFSVIPGVIQTEVGYANGSTTNPTYKEVCSNITGHAETVKIVYNSEIILLDSLLDKFYEVIDPTTLNRQANDFGIQYRSGIYYMDEEDLNVIKHSIEELSKQYKKPIVVEIKKLENYYPAEEHHQNYLDKNPNGYCHISSKKIEEARKTSLMNQTKTFQKKSEEELKHILSDLQYQVTKHSHTEKPFENEYYNNFQEGIYIDITTGEPLFISTDKFESGCGWPSFSKPIDLHILKECMDHSFGMKRVEVRSKLGDSHLGHVFTDGPKNKGGLRYCINSASLKFIPKEEMEKEGYKEYLKLLD